MLQIVDMATVGVFVVMKDGSVKEFDGRSHWYDLEGVREALKRTGQTASDKILRTTIQPSAGKFGPN